MASLKDLKIRIESVKSTRKITKAMQMVAAAKLRRAQERAEAARPYSERMMALLANLTASAGGGASAPKLLAGSGSDKVHLLIVATAERGLCGGFNSSIVRQARQEAEALLAAGKEVKILTIGKKGREQLRRDFADYFIHHVDLSALKVIGYDNASEISADILGRYEAGEFDVAKLFFNRFQSVITQIPTIRQLIPYIGPEDQDDAGDAKKTSADPNAAGSAQYEYEPSEGAVLADLLPRAITTEIFAALLENGASEQGARMSAMDNATRNAGEMIDKLTIEFNRSRQAAITNELIEIISGAEAL